MNPDILTYICGLHKDCRKFSKDGNLSKDSESAHLEIVCILTIVGKDTQL